MKTNIIPKLILLLALAAGATGAYAQSSGGVLGKIDAVIREDDSYLVIDGTQMVVHWDDLVITYKGKSLRATVLESGQSLRYKTRADGSVSEITLLGPTAVLDNLNNH